VALLNRQMQFKTISVIDVGSTAAGYLVGIGMALLDWGYWSLVGGTVSTGTLRMTAIWAVARWRPQRPTKRSGTRPLVRFGADLTFVGVLHSFARGSDTLLLGRFVGSEAVGLYSRATALLTRPLERLTSTITSVIVPALSRLQSEPDRYRQAFLLVFEGLAIIGFVFTGLFLPLAHPVVAVMFGQQWEAAAPIFAALTIAAVYLPLSNATSWIYTSQGRGRDLLLTASVGACVMVASFSAGLAFGPTGVAIGYSLSGVLVQLPVTCYIAGRSGPVSARDLWVTIIRHFPLCVVVLAATALAALSTAQLSPLTRLLLGVPSGLLAGAASLVLLPHTRHTATRILRALNDLRRPENPSVQRSTAWI
jgi:PST family polysaccharide transporter